MIRENIRTTFGFILLFFHSAIQDTVVYGEKSNDQSEPSKRVHGSSSFFADVDLAVKLGDDMFGYEPGGDYEATKGSKRSTEFDKDDSSARKINELKREVGIAEEQLTKCQLKLSKWEHEKVKMKADIIKQLVKLVSKEATNGASTVKVHIVITQTQRDLLELVNRLPYARKRDVGIAYDALLEIFEGANFTAGFHVPPENVYFFESLILFGAVTTCLVFCGVLISKLRFRLSIAGVLLLIFFIGFVLSIPWEWYRLYKVALAAKIAQQAAMKSSKCDPDQRSNWQSLKLWFQHTFTFKEDECLKYHKSVLVDPTLEVSPVKAISSVLTTFVVTPLSLISEELGKSITSLMKELPLQWQLPILLSILFLLVVIIVLYFGVEINLPFINFKAGHGRGQRPLVDQPQLPAEHRGKPRVLLAAPQPGNVDAQQPGNMDAPQPGNVDAPQRGNVPVLPMQHRRDSGEHVFQDRGSVQDLPILESESDRGERTYNDSSISEFQGQVLKEEEVNRTHSASVSSVCEEDLETVRNVKKDNEAYEFVNYDDVDDRPQDPPNAFGNDNNHASRTLHRSAPEPVQDIPDSDVRPVNEPAEHSENWWSS